MYVELEDFKTGWYQIYVGIRKNEIAQLIDFLKELQQDESKHFHIFSDYEREGGIGDIEFYSYNGEEDNMTLA